MNTSQIEKELQYRHSRSSGSGGQHVNKVATRVELLFSVEESLGLSEKEKERFLAEQTKRINAEGVFLLSEQGSRSQILNKRRVTKRFFQLLEESLQPKKARKGPPSLKANKKKRLESKRKQSEKKAFRKKVDWPG